MVADEKRVLEQRVEALEAEERVESARYTRLAAERVRGDERVAQLERAEGEREEERAREDALRARREGVRLLFFFITLELSDTTIYEP